ncbi:unnamed protein product [Lota lota]
MVRLSGWRLSSTAGSLSGSGRVCAGPPPGVGPQHPSHPLCQAARQAEAPCSTREMGKGPVALGEGGPTKGCSGPCRELPPQPKRSPLTSPVQTALPQPSPQTAHPVKAVAQASGPTTPPCALDSEEPSKSHLRGLDIVTPTFCTF